MVSYCFNALERPMQIRHFWLAAAALFMGIAIAGDLPNCAVSVHHVGDAGDVGAEALIGQSHVLKVEAYKDILSEAFPDVSQWRVTLSAEGVQIAQAYTARNLGRPVAVFCDGKEVARPVVRTVLREQFVFGVQPGAR